MSEYQYYEFRAIDRRLTESEMDALRDISSRAEITPTSFTNHYEWGDLKADPLNLLGKYFDAFVYVANWGVREFYLRFPQSWFDYNELRAWLPGETASVQRTKKGLIVGFGTNVEFDEWDDGTRWMGPLVYLRSDLLRGDLRCLYLGWLRAVQIGEVPDELKGPPVPEGLGKLSPALETLIDFLDIDRHLVSVAAANSAPLSPAPGPGNLNNWIRNLTENEKNDLLIAAVSESGDHWKNDLLRRFYRENKPPASPGIAPPQNNTAADLRSAAQSLAEETEKRLEAERIAEAAQQKQKEEAARTRYLTQLKKREPATWDDVFACVQKRLPKEYDQAVKLLIDLRDLAVREKRETEFQGKIDHLRLEHAAKVSFLARLKKANL